MILVCGHYCHDLLIAKDGSETRVLGGSASYAAAVLDAFAEPYRVAAKAGPDFRYAAELTHQPRIVPAPTTSFVDDYRMDERHERVEALCDPLAPDDLPQGPFDVGLAFGVAGEVPVPVLQRLRSICRIVLADAQSLLRTIAPDGAVLLRAPQPSALDQLDWLKASRGEAALLDLPQLRGRAGVIVTDGARGCTLLTPSGDLHVPAPPAVEVDPTGAGDCFLTGFAIGLRRGWTPTRAAALGAWCGARAVEQLGVPRLRAPESFPL
ncbi:MAG TPA: PfkB family carbohydrate kinase [Myxococcales bacterium]